MGYRVKTEHPGTPPAMVGWNVVVSEGRVVAYFRTYDEAAEYVARKNER